MMVAATKYTEAAILDVAAAEIATAGFQAASVASIARALGAPNGSIYHRFASKQHLIGALWVRTARRYAASLSDALETTDLDQLPARIVNHAFDWVAGHPIEANLLMQFRTEDFNPADWPKEVVVEIDETNQALAAQLLGVAELHGIHPIDMTLAAIDVPATAARRAILSGAGAADEAHIRRRTTELAAHLISASP